MSGSREVESSARQVGGATTSPKLGRTSPASHRLMRILRGTAGESIGGTPAPSRSPPGSL